MPDVTSSIGLVGQIADALDKVTETVENAVRRGYRGYSFVARQRERQRYVDMLHNFTRMRRTQGIMLGSLRYYLANPAGADWSYMAQTLEALTPVVDELIGKLAEERGDIVLHERQAFADLGAALQGRKEILDWLSTLKPPLTGGAVDSLRALAAEYGRLITSSERAATAIEAYARSLT